MYVSCSKGNPAPRQNVQVLLLQGQVSLDHAYYDHFQSTVSRLGHLGLNHILNCWRVFNPPQFLIPLSTKGGQLDHLRRKKSRGDLIQTWKILHKHDDVKEGTWFTRSVDTAQREARFSTCNMNLNSTLCNLDIRRNFFSL